MRNLGTGPVSRLRIKTRLGWGDETCGAFLVPSPIDGARLRVIASAGGGWDHVSVSRPKRCPNWPEMDHVKRLFFDDSEVVVQFHVPAADHVNLAEFCLHLWRPQDVDVPRPPSWMVGPVPGQTVEESLGAGRTALAGQVGAE